MLFKPVLEAFECSVVCLLAIRNLDGLYMVTSSWLVISTLVASLGHRPEHTFHFTEASAYDFCGWNWAQTCHANCHATRHVFFTPSFGSNDLLGYTESTSLPFSGKLLRGWHSGHRQSDLAKICATNPSLERKWRLRIFPF